MNLSSFILRRWQQERKCGMNNVLMWILIILGIVVIGFLLIQILLITVSAVIITVCWIKVWKEEVRNE